MIHYWTELVVLTERVSARPAFRPEVHKELRSFDSSFIFHFIELYISDNTGLKFIKVLLHSKMCFHICPKEENFHFFGVISFTFGLSVLILDCEAGLLS